MRVANATQIVRRPKQQKKWKKCAARRRRRCRVGVCPLLDDGDDDWASFYSFFSRLQIPDPCRIIGSRQPAYEMHASISMLRPIYAAVRRFRAVRWRFMLCRCVIIGFICVSNTTHREARQQRE